MASPAREDLETFLGRQDAATLAAVLLELARELEPVRKRLERMQLARRPDKLAAAFKKTLALWRRSKTYHGYRETRAFGQQLQGWLDQVARELLPLDPPAAVALFEAFIEADANWFDHADDSDGLIGDVVRSACRHWLQAAARCETPVEAWPERLFGLHQADRYGARDELLRRADLLLDAPALRALVARLEAQHADLLASVSSTVRSDDSFRVSAALSLLSESLKDPDIMVRATLRGSPDPNPVQRQHFARAYLDVGRPTDALVWLQDRWNHFDDSRQDLLAQALEALGRFEQSLPIRQRNFERTLSSFDYERWLQHLPDAARAGAAAHARELALSHEDSVTAAELLLVLDDPATAEARVLADAGRIDGTDYGRLVPLAKNLHDHECPLGEIVVYRALLLGILERAYARAYGHAGRYWRRLGELAGSLVGRAVLPSHEEFTAEIRRRHARKVAFWAHVDGDRRDRHDEEADL